MRIETSGLNNHSSNPFTKISLIRGWDQHDNVELFLSFDTGVFLNTLFILRQILQKHGVMCIMSS